MRPPLVVEKSCVRCGKGFQPQSNRQKCCSHDCHYPPRKCQHCGAVFTPRKHSSGDACSSRCSRFLLWKRWGRQTEKPCERCGKPISGSQRRRFCSRPCLWAALRRSGVCANCGAPTTQARNRYCSKKCSGEVAGRLEKQRRQVGDRRPTKGGYV